jgi:hypothetical protein
MRSVKQLAMYLWDDSGLTASGNHQVIAALEKLLLQRRGDPGWPQPLASGDPAGSAAQRVAAKACAGTATLCTSRAGRLRDQPGGSAAPCVAT